MVRRSYDCFQYTISLIFPLDSIMFKTHADMKSWAHPEPYAASVVIEKIALIQVTFFLAGKKVKRPEMKPLLPKICAVFSSNIFMKATIRR